MRSLAIASLIGTLACSSTKSDLQPGTGADAGGDASAPAIDVRREPVPDTGVAETLRTETGGEVAEPLASGYLVRVAVNQDSVGPIGPGIKPPTLDPFSLHIDRGGDRLVASRGGTVGIAPLRPTPTGWITTGSFRLGVTAKDLAPCYTWGATTYEEMDIVVDGSTLRGTVRGWADYQVADAVAQIHFRGTFTTTVDRDPPTFAIEGGRPHPADELVVRFSEALPAGTTVSLVAPDGGRRALTAAGDPGQPRAAFSLAAPVGIVTGHQLDIQPALRDLAGNAAATLSLPPVESAAIPLLPEDGFEGSVSPYLSGPAQVGSTDPAAIAGQRSLLFPLWAGNSRSPARASFRLAVAPGDKVIRATIRLIMLFQSFDPVTLPLTMVRGDAVTPVGPIKPQGAVARLGTMFASEPQLIEIPLPPGSAPEVLLDLNRPWLCGHYEPLAGVLIDDVRVE